MTLRRAHGNQARHGGPSEVLETLPVEELPVGLPAPARSVSPDDRGERGRFAGGNSLASAGGKARAGTTRLADRLGLQTLPDDSAFAPYKRAAVSYRRATCAAIASTVGGGVCGPIPSSMVASAALALAWARYFSDTAAATNDVDLAMRATKQSESASALVRQAHEYAAKEATARGRAPVTWDELRAGIGPK